MSAAGTALTIAGAIVVGTIAFGMLAAHRTRASRTRADNAQEYIVGGRSFGALLLWILMGGEIYTAFTFLGAAGWVYGRGAPAYYILAYGPIAYIIGYFFMPPVWEFAKARGLLTAADFFAERYASKSLGTFVALLHFCAVLPWYTLQLTGLQILLQIGGYGRIDAVTAVSLGFGLTALFVFTAGLRGTAWASAIKDALVLAAILFAGFALPIRFFGSPARMLSTLIAQRPHWFTLGATTAPQGTVWYVTTVALTGIGFFMNPQSLPAIYAGKSAQTIRRNAMFLPLYSLMLLPVFLAGYTALLIVPGLHGTAADRSYMLVIQRYAPPAVLGSRRRRGLLGVAIAGVGGAAVDSQPPVEKRAERPVRHCPQRSSAHVDDPRARAVDRGRRDRNVAFRPRIARRIFAVDVQRRHAVCARRDLGDLLEATVALARNVGHRRRRS